MELTVDLIHDPDIIFLDEHTIGLDLLSQMNIRKFLKTYNKEFNKTIILTSHYMMDIEDLSQRVIFLNKGKILYDGTVFEFKKKVFPLQTDNC